MRFRYVHVGINPVGAIAAQAGASNPPGYPGSLQTYFASFGADWYRYGAQNFVLWTAMDLTALASGIAQLPGYGNVYVLMTEMAVPANFQLTNGWMPQAFWEWLHKSRT